MQSERRPKNMPGRNQYDTVAGCSVNEQWTPSREGIPGNERADKLANEGQKKPPCARTKTTLAWLRIHSQKQMIEEWELRTPNHETPISTKPDGVLSLIPTYQATRILRLRCRVTDHDDHGLIARDSCRCRVRATVRHTLFNCYSSVF